MVQIHVEQVSFGRHIQSANGILSFPALNVMHLEAGRYQLIFERLELLEEGGGAVWSHG